MNRAASKPSIFLSLFVVQLWICQSARGQVIQTCNRIDGCSCNYKGDVFQLKYLGDYIIKKISSGYLTATYAVDEYYFNPCQPFTRSGSVGTGCTNVLACQHHPDEYDIGSPASTIPGPASPSYSIDGGEVTLDYFAKSTGMWPIRRSKVTCKCDRSIKSLPIFVAKGETYQGSGLYAFDLQHTCCCPGECNSGMPAGGGGGSLSGGSILLILVSLLLLFYLIGGILFMKYKRGAIGSEMIPNKSFWSALPGLMKDGVMFMFSRCLKRGSYSSV